MVTNQEQILAARAYEALCGGFRVGTARLTDDGFWEITLSKTVDSRQIYVRSRRWDTFPSKWVVAAAIWSMRVEITWEIEKDAQRRLR